MTLLIRSLDATRDHARVMAFLHSAADYIRLERGADPSPGVAHEFFTEFTFLQWRYHGSGFIAQIWKVASVGDHSLAQERGDESGSNYFSKGGHHSVTSSSSAGHGSGSIPSVSKRHLGIPASGALPVISMDIVAYTRHDHQFR